MFVIRRWSLTQVWLYTFFLRDNECAFWIAETCRVLQRSFSCLSFSHSGVNFTNILLAQLRQYSCANKKFNLHCKHKKASRKTFVRKNARVKCWWNWPLYRFLFIFLLRFFWDRKVDMWKNFKASWLLRMCKPTQSVKEMLYSRKNQLKGGSSLV